VEEDQPAVKTEEEIQGNSVLTPGYISTDGVFLPFVDAGCYEVIYQLSWENVRLFSVAALRANDRLLQIAYKCAILVRKGEEA
jgi:hypothetical protein